MDIKYVAPAEAELLDAVAYYNSQSEGLGYEFAAEVKRTIERIVQYPDAWTQFSIRTRRRGRWKNNYSRCNRIAAG